MHRRNDHEPEKQQDVRNARWMSAERAPSSNSGQLLGPRLSTSRIMRYIRCRFRSSSSGNNKVVPHPMQLSPLPSVASPSSVLDGCYGGEAGGDSSVSSGITLSRYRFSSSSVMSDAEGELYVIG